MTENGKHVVRFAIGDVEDAFEAIEIAIDVGRAYLKRLESERDELKDQLESADETIDSLREEIAGLKDEIAELTTQLAEATA